MKPKNAFDNFFSRLKSCKISEKKLKLIVIIGFVGIGMIFLSDILFSKENDGYSETAADVVSLDTQDYKKQIEHELTEILNKIDGVGKVSVMLTIEGTTEYVYAEEILQSTDVNSNGTSTKYQSEVVIVSSGGGKEALVKKIIKPQINGVIVVCEGGENARVCEKVIKAVSSVLNISTSRICVAKGN